MLGRLSGIDKTFCIFCITIICVVILTGCMKKEETPSLERPKQEIAPPDRPKARAAPAPAAPMKNGSEPAPPANSKHEKYYGQKNGSKKELKPKNGQKEPFRTYWNVWADEGEGPLYTPVPTLKPNSAYRISLDLASLVYKGGQAQAVETGGTFNAKVEKWVKPNMPPPELRVMLLADPGRFEIRGKRLQEFKINVTKLRKAWKSGSTPVHKNHFQILRNAKVTPDFKFGGISFDVETQNIQGKASLAFSIWDKGRPIDEVSVQFCIAPPGEEKDNCGELKETNYPQGLFSVRVGTEKSDVPRAAMHFVELDRDEKAMGILKLATYKKDEFLVWQLEKTANELRQAISTQFLGVIDTTLSDENLLARGEALFEILFPADARGTDNRNVRAEVLDFVRPQFQKDSLLNEYIPPKLFLRIMQAGPEPSSPIPLGLLSVRLDGKKKMSRENGRFLGEYFLIETPLEIQSYAPEPACLNDWVMVLPPEGTDDTEINNARSQLGTRIEKWREEKPCTIYEKMNDFAEWVGPSSIGDPESSPVFLVTLSHHNNNALYFYKTSSAEDDPLQSEKFKRAFKQPAVALLNGCGTGGQSALNLIRSLNRHGFTTIIAASAEIDGLMAGAFLQLLADEIATNTGPKPRDIGLIYWRTVRKLSQRSPIGVISSGPFGAQALKYCLLGNGNVNICLPKGIK